MNNEIVVPLPVSKVQIFDFLSLTYDIYHIPPHHTTPRRNLTRLDEARQDWFDLEVVMEIGKMCER